MSKKVKSIKMDGATLAFRPREQFKLSAESPNNPQGPNIFAICVLDTPIFPGQREKTYRDEPPKAIVAITYYPNLEGWGFIALEPETKRVIGDLLFDKLQAESGKWYWLVISTLEHP